MCFDERTSWITFLFGTAVCLFNIYYFKTTSILVVSLLWMFVLMMQLFEAIAWRTQKSTSSRLHFWATQGALFANIMQPVIVGLLCYVLITDVSPTSKSIGLALVFGYSLWLIYSLSTSPAFTKLVPKKDCTHLNLAWWDSFRFDLFGYSINGAAPYLVCLFGVLFLMLRPFDLMLFTTFYIFITLVISATFYSCGTGSMWCWFSAFAPLVTGAYLYFTK